MHKNKSKEPEVSFDNCPEIIIQKAILIYLQHLNIFAWRNNNTGLFDPRTQSYRAAPLKGISDIIGILPDGRFLAIEVKTKKGKTTQEQLDFLNNIQYNGGVACVARNIEDVIECLKKNSSVI